MAVQREPDKFYVAVRNPDVYELLARRIREEGRGWLVVGKMPHSGDEAIAMLKAERPRFALIDSRLRNPDGFAVAEVARDLEIGFSVLIAPGDTEGMGRALRLVQIRPRLPVKKSCSMSFEGI